MKKQYNPKSDRIAIDNNGFVTITLEYTHEEMEKLRSAAEREGLSINKFAEKCIYEHYKKHEPNIYKEFVERQKNTK